MGLSSRVVSWRSSKIPTQSLEIERTQLSRHPGIPLQTPRGIFALHRFQDPAAQAFVPAVLSLPA
jgi:hypothetical protein